MEQLHIDLDETTLMSPAIAAMARGLEDGTEEGQLGPQTYGYWRAVAYYRQPQLGTYERTQYEEGFLLGVLTTIQARRDQRYA